jgi:hypothetical protein
MLNLALDASTGDIVFPLKLIDGIDQARQELSSRLKFFRGEYFLDTTIGVPYYQDILRKGASRNLVEGEIKAVIVGTPSVISLVSYSSAFDASTRAYTVRFVAQTTAGIVQMEVSL